MSVKDVLENVFKRQEDNCDSLEDLNDQLFKVFVDNIKSEDIDVDILTRNEKERFCTTYQEYFGLIASSSNLIKSIKKENDELREIVDSIDEKFFKANLREVSIK